MTHPLLSPQQRLDLQSRFLLNLPTSEWKSWYRLWYHIEFAFYYWIDYYVCDEQQQNLQNNDVQSFAKQLLQGLPIRLSQNCSYRHYLSNYKYQIPVYGIVFVLLGNTVSNPTLLLVKNSSSNKWGFSKGKINYNESEWECACRECYEETGLDVDRLLKDGIVNKNNISKVVLSRETTLLKNTTKTTLFIIRVTGSTIVTKYPLHPKNKKEINECQWMTMEELQQKPSRQVSALTRYFISANVFETSNILKKKSASLTD